MTTGADEHGASAEHDRTCSRANKQCPPLASGIRKSAERSLLVGVAQHAKKEVEKGTKTHSNHGLHDQ
eukprot:scaffold2363_cov159-Amphora_coffeaeformis.AAC.54